MLKKPNCPVIAIEEHYWDPELAATYSGVEGTRNDEMLKRLHDLGELRIREMDEAGVDVQLISHGAPSAQKLTGGGGIAGFDLDGLGVAGEFFELAGLREVAVDEFEVLSLLEGFIIV